MSDERGGARTGRSDRPGRTGRGTVLRPGWRNRLPQDGPGALTARRAVGLVARREINSRMRTASFVLSTLGLLLGLGVYALILLLTDDG